MKITGLHSFLIKALLTALLGLALLPGIASATLTAAANHDDIKVDFFYHGSTVSVRGVADPGTDLIIKITSPEEHAAFKKKGKVGGLLWMNVGDVKFEKLPKLYFVRGAKPCDSMLSAEERDKNIIGYGSLEKHVEVSPVSGEAEKAGMFKDLVKFKEDGKLYSSDSGNITVTNENGRQSYYTLFEWPYQAPPGNYVVTVYAVKGNRVVETAEAKVLVEQVGTVKTLADMAKKNAAVYGVLSVLAALLSGFGVGLIFKKGGGAH